MENAYKAIQGRDLWQEALDETKSKLSEADTFEIYRAFAGEVEARNTQARMNMSDEERAATSVESTQDIKNADALVVFPDGTEVAYIPENVRVEDGVVDLSEAFDKTPTIDEVKKYINKICEESKEFATLSPDWIVKAPKGAYRKGHIIYSDKWREMSNAEKERHNKFVLALSEILDNAVYLNSLPNKKTENPKKKNVTNYHYLGATVKIGTETYDVIFDTEQFKDDKINNPRKVSLYNVYEKEKSPFGKSTLASKNPIGNFNKNILQKEDVVNNAYYQLPARADKQYNPRENIPTGELGLEGGREKAPFGAQAQSQKEKVIYQVFGQYEPAKKLITLFQGKNSTTLVHELLHHYLPIYLTELEKAGKFEQLKGLYDALGVQSYSDIARQRAKMEQLIDLGTSYIYYNESPNEASRSLFERAKQWMLDAYGIVKKFVKPSKEVDAFFNELFAREEENLPDIRDLKGKSAELAKILKGAASGQELTVNGLSLRDIANLRKTLYARIPRAGESLADAIRQAGGIDTESALAKALGYDSRKGSDMGFWNYKGAINDESSLIDFLTANGYLNQTESQSYDDTSAIWDKVEKLINDRNSVYNEKNQRQQEYRENALSAQKLNNQLVKVEMLYFYFGMTK